MLRYSNIMFFDCFLGVIVRNVRHVGDVRFWWSSYMTHERLRPR